MKTKILLVEDNNAMRNLVATALDQHLSVDVYEAENGFAALKLIPDNEFQLIITDINMPDINGLELINFVKKNPNYRETPLFIVSTESSDNDRRRGLALGAAEYLVKPFEPEVLTALVRHYMKLE